MITHVKANLEFPSHQTREEKKVLQGFQNVPIFMKWQNLSTPLTLSREAIQAVFTFTPHSTGRTVPLNFAIVRPKRDRTRGSQCSGKRSSLSIGVRSSILPPKIVSIVEELDDSQQAINHGKKNVRQRTWHFRICCEIGSLYKLHSTSLHLLFVWTTPVRDQESSAAEIHQAAFP